MGYCTKCGIKNNDDYEYCLNCGTPLYKEVDLKSDSRKGSARETKSPKKFIIIGVIAFALLGLCTAGFLIFRNAFSKPFGTSQGSLSIYSKDNMVYAFNNGVIVDKKEMDLSEGKRNLDNSAIALIDNDYGLYYFDGKTIDKLENEAMDVAISLDGSKLVYCLDRGLIVYDAKSKKKELVTTNIVDSFAISPNGKYLAYLDENGSVYLNGNKKTNPLEIGDVYTIIAVNNDKELFFADENDNLYVLSKEGTVLEIAPGIDEVHFNRDNSECAVIGVENIYLYKDGKANSFLQDDVGEIERLLYPTAMTFSENTDYYIDVYNNNIDSFTDKYYVTYYGSLVKVDKNLKIENVINEEAYEYCISLDGKTVYYLANDNIYVYDGKKTELLVNNVYKLYDCDIDGKGVYFLTSDDKLGYVDSKKHVNMLGEYEPYSFIINKGNYLIFLDKASKFAYSSKRGNGITPLIEKETTTVRFFLSYGTSYLSYDDAFYSIDDECRVHELTLEMER